MVWALMAGSPSIGDRVGTKGGAKMEAGWSRPDRFSTNSFRPPGGLGGSDAMTVAAGSEAESIQKMPDGDGEFGLDAGHAA